MAVWPENTTIRKKKKRRKEEEKKRTSFQTINVDAGQPDVMDPNQVTQRTWKHTRTLMRLLDVSDDGDVEGTMKNKRAGILGCALFLPEDKRSRMNYKKQRNLHRRPKNSGAIFLPKRWRRKQSHLETRHVH